MPVPSHIGVSTVQGEESGTKLGKIPLYGIVLGHVISPKGIEVDKAKVDLISNLPPPWTVKEIWSFLGHVGFYRRFIKDFSKIAKPLCNLLAKDVPFDFNDKCQTAFEILKKTLTFTPIIQPPN
jgi:hypothetical protein